MPMRAPVCRAVLALAAAAPLSAFAAVDADAGEAAPAAVVQELAPTVAYAGTASAPFARNTHLPWSRVPTAAAIIRSCWRAIAMSTCHGAHRPRATASST